MEIHDPMEFHDPMEIHDPLDRVDSGKAITRQIPHGNGFFGFIQNIFGKKK